MRIGEWKRRVERLKRNTAALYFASRHPRTPIIAKLVVLATVAYALSPIDLIPDFIPILGYLDDLVLLPAGIWIARRLVPEPVWLECQQLAAQQTANLAQNRRAAMVIILVWILACAWLSGLLWRVAWHGPEAGEATVTENPTRNCRARRSLPHCIAVDSRHASRSDPINAEGR